MSYCESEDEFNDEDDDSVDNSDPISMMKLNIYWLVEIMLNILIYIKVYQYIFVFPNYDMIS